jgi:hypothetical protein
VAGSADGSAAPGAAHRGCGRFDEDEEPRMTIAELIRENALKITDTMELYKVLQHYPDATPQQVAAELRRQAKADAAEADQLDIYLRHRAAND